MEVRGYSIILKDSMKNQEELDTLEKWVEKWQDKFQFALEYAKFYIWV